MYGICAHQLGWRQRGQWGESYGSPRRVVSGFEGLSPIDCVEQIHRCVHHPVADGCFTIRRSRWYGGHGGAVVHVSVMLIW